MLTTEQYRRLRCLIAPYMSVDRYGLTTIYSLYFDSADNRMILRSLDKPIYKEKLRLRAYGRPADGGSTVFMELKKKFKGTVYKRRAAMTLAQAENYILTGEKPFESQIMNEIDYCRDFYDAQPSLMMCYDRIALFGTQDEQIRMTFDFNVRCRRNDLNLIHGDAGSLIMDGGSVLLEIKIVGSQIRAYPTSFSKYGEYFRLEAAGEQDRYGTYSEKMAAMC